MKGKSDNRIEDLLSGINDEFYKLNPTLRPKFAIGQISMWQQKFSEAKNEIPKENVVDGAAVGEYISQYAEIEA